uniref:Uncharacterized protein n=1 Tax=Lotharella globosa TaxID=91324 RepID=A0A7S3ZEF4_9EUKA
MVYDKGHVVFRTAPKVPSRKYLIFVGGLTDGLMATNYVAPLAKAVNKREWTFLQPLISSSYTGYGSQSLALDCQELSELVRIIRKEQADATIVLMGHSTGCQDAVTYCRRYHQQQMLGAESRINGVILQAPVSDRESMAMKPEEKTKKWLKLATSMIKEGKAEDLMPQESYFIPITAYRYHSLAGKNTDDDLFSSDFTMDELKGKLGCVDVAALVLYSGEDEYVPDYVNRRALVDRMSAATGTSQSLGVLIECADHAASSPEATEKVVDLVSRFLDGYFCDGNPNLVSHQLDQ